jgi:SAM-dependent MidA family methyltransferase
MAQIPWREAMDAAVRRFFTSVAPGDHFRTSVHASGAFTGALARLVDLVDETLGRPDPLHIVDVGAGRGELLTALAGSRRRLTAVELAPRPPDLPSSIEWVSQLPARFTGVLIATEWLDNVPLDVVEVDSSGVVRYVLVDPDTGAETLGGGVSSVDAAWLDRWWPLAGAPPGARAEIGRPRDSAWASAVSAVERGLAVCVDYGHVLGQRPLYGTLTGYRGGRQVPPVPDGTCDITAHVAMDSLDGVLMNQRSALRALGVDGGRPPLALASTDPAAYLRGLAAASAAAELTDPAGLGGHYWLLRPVGIDLDPVKIS